MSRASSGGLIALLLLRPVGQPGGFASDRLCFSRARAPLRPPEDDDSLPTPTALSLNPSPRTMFVKAQEDRPTPPQV